MAELIQYKCPNCNGGLEFDSNSQNMKCPYCDAEFEVQSLKTYDEDLKADEDDNMTWDTKAGKEWEAGETAGMVVYQCESCNGEVIADETLGATACPYCGNPIIMKGQFAGDIKPDLVIPFKLDKDAAKERFKSYLLNKKLLPESFKTESSLEEIKGVYVPFWIFDSDADARIRYKATRTRVWSDSRYRYHKTSYYSVVRGGKISFKAVPVDGSSKMDDTLMESLEPFDVKEAVDFQTAFLSGYLADKYDVDAEASIDRANERIKQSTVESFRETVTGYDAVMPESVSINLKNGKSSYALYPVWVMTVRWDGNPYMFAMNGQTGKFVGNLPCDKGLYKKYLFRTLGITSAITMAVLSAFWMFM